MMQTPHSPIAPPRYSQAVMRYMLPCDPMRDSIFGDLHEQFVDDIARFGPARARAYYTRRVAGIVAHAAFDSLRWRSWVSTTPPAKLRSSVAEPNAGAAPGATVPQPQVAYARTRVAGGGAGLAALALGVLSIGIVVNTMLFSAVRQAPKTAAYQGSLLSSTVGIGAVVLALACAGVAAVVLCAGPRWLRQRLRKT